MVDDDRFRAGATNQLLCCWVELLAHTIELCWLDILFSSNRNIHKSSYGLCFCASDPLIERFY